jgi:hypothetical protein
VQLRHLALSLLFVAFAAPSVRAEYIVLRGGQRLAVTGYQILGDKYRLQVKGGTVDVPTEQVLSIEPEEVFTPVPVPHVEVSQSQEPFGELIRAAAERYKVDADLITSIIAAESNFDPKAISRRNARGLMQLLPSTATRLGVKNIFDPQQNIDAGTHYLGDLLQLYKNDLTLALAAYNAGPEQVLRHGQRVPPFAETISYIKRVSKTYNQRKSNGSSAADKTPVHAAPVAATANTATPAGNP